MGSPVCVVRFKVIGLNYYALRSEEGHSQPRLARAKPLICSLNSAHIATYTVGTLLTQDTA